MVLVGVLLVASMRSVGGVYRTWSTSRDLHARMSLAQQLMAEILQQSYADPNESITWGPEASESTTNRSTWDDVDDYDGWSSAPQRKDGTAIAGYEAWRRDASIVYASLSDPTQASLTNTGLKRVTVTVTDATGKQSRLQAYRSRWGTLEQSPDATDQFVVHVASELQIGAAPKLQSGTHLSNHAIDTASP